MSIANLLSNEIYPYLYLIFFCSDSRLINDEAFLLVRVSESITQVVSTIINAIPSLKYEAYKYCGFITSLPKLSMYPYFPFLYIGYKFVGTWLHEHSTKVHHINNK